LAGIRDIDEIEISNLEINGQISFIKKDKWIAIINVSSFCKAWFECSRNKAIVLYLNINFILIIQPKHAIK
jgi:hypothetical protein